MRYEEHVRREQREAEARAKAPSPPRCVHCGQSELWHKPEFVTGPTGHPQKIDRLAMKVPCLGYRENFKPTPEATNG